MKCKYCHTKMIHSWADEYGDTWECIECGWGSVDRGMKEHSVASVAVAIIFGIVGLASAIALVALGIAVIGLVNL